MLAATAKRPRPYKPRPYRTRADGRTVGARRFSTLVRQFTDELGGSPLSAIDSGLVKQASALSLRIEQLQVAIIKGESSDSDEIIRLSSEHRRLLTSLRAKAVKNKPTGATALQDYLARKADALEASK